eukprot:6310801-Heterocapsa_arctica.AAC.1
MRGIEGQCSAGARLEASALGSAAVARVAEEQLTTFGSTLRATAGRRVGGSAVGPSALRGRPPANPCADAQRVDSAAHDLRPEA